MRCDFLRYTKYLCENTPFYISQSLVEVSCQLNRCFRSLHGVAPDRVYIVKPMLPWAGWALTPPFHPYLKSGGISLLHLSWGYPRRALPVILTLWSPDFPHLGPFGTHPRLSNLVAEILYSISLKKSNVLQNLLRGDILCVGKLPK